MAVQLYCWLQDPLQQRVLLWVCVRLYMLQGHRLLSGGRDVCVSRGDGGGR